MSTLNKMGAFAACVKSAIIDIAIPNSFGSEKGIDMAAPFGERIRELRKKKGLTLDQLAALTESSKSYIWELENKEPPRPSADKIAKIAAALDVTGDYLMGTDGIDLQSAEDQAFFRKYSQMDPDTRARLRRLAKALDEDD